MGFLQVELVSENGEVVDEVDDPRDLLARLLPSKGLSPLLDFLDPYGDTVFNWIQMKPFLSEWKVVEANASTDEERELTAAVTRLALRCQQGHHEYLKFVGD